ncbi:MAG: EF-hand domain-containing protein [Giesbergeria sp.]|nr:EF-hand domain-containing protein [Giesbergeria sp.]
MRFLRPMMVVWLLGAAAVAGAQQAAPASPANPDGAPLSKGEIKAIRDFKLLDFNGDGKISRAEVALFPRLAAAFNDADTNHDNYLSYEEVRAYAVVYRAERERQRERERERERAAQSQKEPEKPHIKGGQGA